MSDQPGTEKLDFSCEVGEADDQVDPFTGDACALLEGDVITTVEATDGVIKAYLACAGTGLESLPACGIASRSFKQGEMGTFFRRGHVRERTGLTAPGPVFLGNTNGAISNTAGDTTQLIGYQEFADDAYYFDPDKSVTPVHPVES